MDERNLFRWTTDMEKLPEVESAKTLMNEAMAWSVMKWLREKKRVRKTADQANAALDQLSARTRERWPDPVRVAYEKLLAPASGTATAHEQLKPRPLIPRAETLTAKKMKESDDEAHRARMDAEEAFDLAEKRLSTRLAREGCQKAIHSWDLHEKAIRKAEALIRSK
jgi:hypothetical protein